MRFSAPWAALVVLILVMPATAAAQIEEMEGTWLLIPEKSIGPSPVWETLEFRIEPGMQHYEMNSRDAEGNEGLTTWSVQYDGRDHPASSGQPGATASIRRTGDKTEFVVNKRNGEITSTYTRVLADDDRTIMSIGRDEDGTIQWVRVFERQ